jgi:hypothetical protein
LVPFIHAPIFSRLCTFCYNVTNAHTLLGHTQASHTLTNLTVLHTGDNQNVLCDCTDWWWASEDWNVQQLRY